jgi:hypothetical protein
MLQFIFFLVVIVFSYMTMSIITMSVNWSDFKNYKKTYIAIQSGEYVLTHISVFVDGLRFYKKRYTDNNDHTEIILFFDEYGQVSSIKLLSNNINFASYIHKSTIIFDLYSMYWFKKISIAVLKQGDYVYKQIHMKKYSFNNFKFLSNYEQSR